MITMNKAQEIAEFIFQDFEKHKNNKQYFLFECNRYHPIFKYFRSDNNAFCTAYILHRLLKNKSVLSDSQKSQLAEALSLFKERIGQYKHIIKRDSSYNFYQNHPKTNFFPNSNFIGKFKHFKLADEIDTSALVYQVLENKNELIKLFDLADSFARYHPSPALAEMANYKVYGTWFGTKTNFEIDLCALCNFLELKFHHSKTLSQTDLSSLNFIRENINQKWWQKYTYFLSPSYQKPIIVAYHLARFMNLFPQHFSKAQFQNLKEDINNLESTNVFELGLKKYCVNRLDSSTIRDKSKVSPIPLKVIEFSSPWFRAAFLSVFKNRIIHKLGKSELFQMHFHCPSLLKAIELEEFN